MVRTRDLTKRYGATHALEGLDRAVEAGSVLGFLGPNGAGKTTAIRMLAGLIRPTRGTAAVAGFDVVRERRAVHARIGYLSGEFRAYRDLTAARYLRYLVDLRGGAGRERVGELAERLDLPLDRRIAELSHGNRQKVGLVQALMADPPVLLLDEPTQGLDPLVQREFLALIGTARDRGCAVLLSSHILSEVEAVADRIGILRAGRLVALDTVAALHGRALRRLDLVFAGDPPAAVVAAVPGVRILGTTDRTLHVEVEGSTAALIAALGPHAVDDVVSHEPGLEEIFLSLYADGAAA
ncbi:MAG: ABC transporter ATP-binding protein [Phycisphaerales bacterium]